MNPVQSNRLIIRVLGAVILLFVVTFFVWIAGDMGYTFFEAMQRVGLTLVGLGVLLGSVAMIMWDT